jgi:hypothetical protein
MKKAVKRCSLYLSSFLQTNDAKDSFHKLKFHDILILIILRAYWYFC